MGVAVGRAFTVFQRVGVGRKELKSAPDARFVLADLGDALECLVVRIYLELGEPQMPAESLIAQTMLPASGSRDVH